MRPCEREALVELVREPDSEDVDEPVDRAGRARSDGNDDVVPRRPDVRPDLPEGPFVALGHEAPGEAAFRVRVRHEGEDAFVQLLLDLAVEAAGGDEVEVAEGHLAEGTGDRGSGADHATAQSREERGLFGRRGRDDGTAGRGGRRVDEAGRPGSGAGQRRPPRRMRGRARPRIASALSRAPRSTPSQTIEQIFKRVGSAIE